MAEHIESPTSARVRDLIFAYERQASIIEPLETYNGRPRAKSIGNALSYKLFRQPNLEFNSVIDIEKELVKIEAHLNYYEVYEKETHVAFQEQLFNVLTSIVRIDPEDHEHATEIKKRLIQETQKLATELNTRLPYDRTLSYKASRSYSNLARKEEAVVSTSTGRSQEHRVVLSSHSSTLNGGFKSEDSLNSFKDSVDLTFRIDDSSSVDLNRSEERPQSGSPPPQKNILEDVQAESIPSVSRLKKYFSFRRETKPEVRVTSASYSGITRSQSLNTKTSKYTILKRSKHEEEIASRTQESFNETDEMSEADSIPKTNMSVTQDINRLDVVSTQSDVESSENINAPKGFEVGDDADIEEARKEPQEIPQNISVSKLKNLFEANHKESNEGSYMNFTGLLRNVDIKKNEISKSKSLSDLKVANLSYSIKDNGVYEDLSNELDGDNDQVVSVEVKDSKEVNNNFVTNESSTIHTSSTMDQSNDDIKHTLHRTIQPIPNPNDTAHEPVLKVPIQLRAGYSSFNRSEKITENSRLRNTTEEKHNRSTHVVHKITESTSVTNEKPEEPKLKVPIQLRPGHSNENSSEKNTEKFNAAKQTTVLQSSNENTTRINETTTFGSVEQLKQTFETVDSTGNTESNNKHIKQIIHRTLEPSTIVNTDSKEPKLKVPIQLRTGFLNERNHQESTDESISAGSIENSNKDINHILHRTIEPDTLAKNDLKEPKLKVPIQLRTGFLNERHHQESTEEKVSTSSIENSNEDIKHILHRTIEPDTLEKNDLKEPKVKVPIQLRTGFLNERNHQESTENQEIRENHQSENKVQDAVVTTGTVEMLKYTFESTVSTSSISRNSEDVNSSPQKTVEEPLLKIPIQLRTNVGARFEESSEHEKVANDRRSTVVVSTGAIESLKQSFENAGSSSSTETTNEDIKHIVNRTIHPISSSEVSEEQVLKVPIQLRSGFSKEGHYQQSKEVEITEHSTEESKTLQSTTEILASTGTVKELKQTFESLDSSSSSDVNNTDIKHILHRIVETDSEKNNLKVPIQLRTGFDNTHEEEKTIESSSNSEVNNEDIKHILHRTVEPDSEKNSVKVPIQLRKGFVNINAEKETVEFSSSSEGNIEDIKHILHRTVEPHPEKNSLKVPIQLRKGFVDIHDKNETIESSSISGVNNEDIKHIIHRTVESDSEKNDLKVPIQLRKGFVNIHQKNETMESTSSSEVSNDDIKHILHRTVEPHPEKNNLKVPIQLRKGFVDIHDKTANIESSSISEVNNEDIKHIIHRAVESDSEKNNLKFPIQLRKGFVNIHQKNETMKSSSSSEVNNDDVKHIIHRTVEPHSEKNDLKVPIQLRKGFVDIHDKTENIESSSISEVNNEDIKHVIHRTVESDTEKNNLKVPIQLRKGFVNIHQKNETMESSSSSEVDNEDIKHIIHRTVEPHSEKNTLKVPIQLKTGFVNLNNDEKEIIESSSSSEVSSGDIRHILHRTVEPDPQNNRLKAPIQLRTSFMNIHSDENEVTESSSEHITEISQGALKESHLQRSLSKIIQPSGNKVTSVVTAIASGDVRISTTAQNQETDSTLGAAVYINESDTTAIDEEEALSRASIQEKTQSFLKILESPTHLSSRISSTSFGQAQHSSSSTSTSSVSYSEKRSVQHSTTTQRIVSSTSSSSSQSSQSFLQVHKGAVSGSLFGTMNTEDPNERSEVTITEVEEDYKETDHPKVNLNVSQENIIDEILKETDSLENIEEEFEKMLDKYAM